jgi:hypothetical protein
MCTIVILFVLILCVACIKKRDDSDEEDEHEDIRRQFEAESESEMEEEEEDPITLTEVDYDRFFPIINTEKHNKKGKLKEEICSICIDKILNGEKVRKIKYCAHYFHSGCLTDWVKVNESCPNCKLELDKQNMEKMEQQAKAEKAKKKAKNNRIGLIDPNKKPLMGTTPTSSKKMLKKPTPIEGPQPSRLRNFSREQLDDVDMRTSNVYVTRQ